MAVNVPLYSGSEGSFPLLFQGEIFLLTRDKTEVSFRDGSRSAKNMKGRLYITNLRMVFMVTEAHRSSAECENFEMPFRGILNESFNQPIFGCNNLQATILYYDDQPFTGTLTIRINFVRGGAGTFLGVFNRVLLATRQQMEQQRRSQQHIPPLYIPEQPTSVQDYLPNHNAAFVDPQDPSTLYTTQPTMNATPRQDIPSWSISGQGLRRR